MPLPKRTDDPYFHRAKVTHTEQAQPDSAAREGGIPSDAQIFKPEPGKNTLSCAADISADFEGRVRLLIWRGKTNKWCIDDYYDLKIADDPDGGPYTFAFKTAGHMVALWLESVSEGTLNSLEGVLIDNKTGGF